MGAFTFLGRMISKAPLPFAILMPVISITFMIAGFQNFEVETSVDKLWIPESTTYAEDSAYKMATGGGSTSSDVLAISVPRRGGNVLTAELLLELQYRLNDTQSTKVEVDGIEVSFDDVCFNINPYTYPCFRMHVLDCFAEGGYDFGLDAAQVWRKAAQEQAQQHYITDGQVTDEGMNEILDRLYQPLVLTGLTQVSPCNTLCQVDGHSKFIAQLLNQPAGTWESDPTCTACLQQSFNQSSQSASGRYMLDLLYVNAMEQGFQQFGFNITAKMLQQQLNTSSEKEALDKYLATSPLLTLQAGDLIKAEVEAMLAGQTPYTFNNSRLYLKDPSTGSLASEEEVLAAASAPCYAWVGAGTALPPNVNMLLYGEPLPLDYSVSNPLKSVAALEHIYRFVMPKDLQKRLAMRPVRHGGPLNISETQAEEALEKYKERFEEALSYDWDDEAGGSLQHTAFSDESGAAGTFGRTLHDLTTDSMPLIAIYGGVTVLLTALFFFSTDLVASRVLLVASGSLLAILGCFAALALSLLCGISLNVVHFWTMPFIIIGIGIDDMFMLALSSRTVQAGNTSEAFAEAFANVAVPVTMTSLVNAAMFGIMSFTSDIRAVYQAGYTGLIATLILHLTMLLSFSALVYLDSQRRSALRYECLPCRKLTQYEDRDQIDLSKLVYTRFYKPAMTSRIGRVGTLVTSVGVIVAGAVGVTELPVGLDLHDFFPTDSAAGQFAVNRNEYFPAWPVEMNWGRIEYTNPQVQMQMAHQWEQVLSSDYIADEGLKTTFVWTAAFASWGMTNTGSVCKAVLGSNVLGLKLVEQGGYCITTGNGSKCPVFEGLSNAQFHNCILQWIESNPEVYAVIAPGLAWGLDGKTIVRSSASASLLFAHNLRTTEDYTNMIKETRKYVDDDESLHSWMSGVPFDYWEQYLSIVDVMLTIGGLSIAVGLIISFAFIFTEMSFNAHGTLMQRLRASALGSFLIALTSTASLMTVVGFCGLASIQLSGFTAMSCVMSTGLAVEYSVHVTHRFLEAPDGAATSRIHSAMEWLFAPNAMAFLTSALSVVMMAFSEFRFVRLYFFAPLAAAVLTSFFFGAFALPCLLGCLECIPAVAVATTEEVDKVDARHDDTNAVEPQTPLSPKAV
jgi:hypothetical protein